MMKKIFYIGISFLLSVGIPSSCRKADELPPIDKMYAKEIVLPDPVDLTRTDRAYLEELEEEYNNSLN